MSKVVVTGGSGFIGSHLVRALVQEGYEVHVIDIVGTPHIPERLTPEATYHQGDIRDRALVAQALEGTELVFHLAALPRVQFSIEHPDETHAVNVDGTLNLLLAARDAGVKRFVNSSSSSVYGDQDSLPLEEGMVPNPKSPYGLHKYIGEGYCRVFSTVYGLPTVSLRYFNVYGPHDDPQGAYALVIPRFIAQRVRGEPMTIAGDGTNSRDYTHVRDIVRANLLAATSPRVGAGEVFNIGAGRGVSVNEVAERVGGEVVHVEARLEPAHTLSDTTRARAALGWEPTVTFEEGVDDLKRAVGLL